MRTLKFWLKSVWLHTEGAPTCLVGTFIDELPHDAKDAELCKASSILEEELQGFDIISNRNTPGRPLAFFPVCNVKGKKEGFEELKHSIDHTVRDDERTYPTI